MAVQVWFEKSMHKIFPQEAPCQRDEAHIYAARFEGEACQLVLRADEDTTVQVTFSSVSNAAGKVLAAEVFEVLYLQAGSHGVWVDPLRPFEDYPTHICDTQWRYNPHNGRLTVKLPGNYTARLFEIVVND